MGLRIIGKLKTTAKELTPAERERELEHTMTDWLHARGNLSPEEAKEAFMAHFCRVKSRMQGSAEPEAMLQMAHQFRANLRGEQGLGIVSHSKVDVATLLELL